MPDLNSATSLNILYSLLALAIIYGSKAILLRFLHNKITDITLFYRTKRVINTSAFFLLVIILSTIWLQAGTSMFTYLGLISAGLALALKDILLNLAGWLYILLRQPFVVGDRIEIDGVKGDVIDQNLFKFRVIEIGNWVDAEQSTGRIIHIPNAKIFTDSLANYTLGFAYIWEEIRVWVTFESNWRKAKQILTEVVNEQADDLSGEAQKRIRETSRRYLIYYTSLTPTVYTDVVESGVRLTMRFLCDPKQRRIVDERIWEAVLDRFGAEPDIDIAYPTMRRIQT